MKTYQPNEIKNIAFVGNAGSGKTILAESIMYATGIINRKGDVENKNTVSDYNAIEHEYIRSVFSTILSTEYQNKRINIIDTPGLDDFSGGVVSSFSVSDTGILLLNAQQGVEVGTEIIGRLTEKNNKPLIFVVNQLDHDKANFEKTIESAKQYFGNKVVLVQYPIETGSGFNAVVDLLKMKMYKWTSEGGKPEIVDIPDNEKDKAEKLHEELVEAAAENDEKLMELFFEEGTLNEDQMREGIKSGLISRGIFPVFCISAKKDMGIHRLLEFIANVCPSVADVPMPKTNKGKEVKCDPNGPASIFIFKTSFEPHLGELNYFKVMSGVIEESMDLINQSKSNKERLSQLFSVAGKNRDKVLKFSAGDIGVTVKLKDTKTNNTLNVKDTDWIFPNIDFPEPKYRTAIKALSESDDERLGEILHKMHDEDPTLIIEYSKELKQIIIHGQGEFHLNTLKWHFDNIYKLETEFIAPKIPYRETITKAAQADYRHKKQSGGAGQFGEVYIVIEPYKEGMPEPSKYKFGDKEIAVSIRKKEEHNLSWGGKLIFYNCIVGGSIDARFLPAILKGVMEKMEEGPLTGCYARDIRMCVYDGKMHSVDSNEISFKIAGMQAFKSAFKEAGPKILEPIYKVEVLVPSDYMGDVISDIQGRRGIMEGMNNEGRYEKINVKVPLAEMNKYSTALSSLTSGKATYTMKFESYTQVPAEIQTKLIKEYEKSEEEE
ncbi:MAG: elongation factor G [Bacteroidales bacterium]|nr:elongation factor G [Bacteroidales bacterium]